MQASQPLGSDASEIRAPEGVLDRPYPRPPAFFIPVTSKICSGNSPAWSKCKGLLLCHSFGKVESSCLSSCSRKQAALCVHREGVSSHYTQAFCPVWETKYMVSISGQPDWALSYRTLVLKRLNCSTGWICVFLPTLAPGLRQCLLFGEGGKGRSRLDPGGRQANHVIKKQGSQNLDLQKRPLISRQPRSKWHSTSARREGRPPILGTNCHYWLHEDPVVNTCHLSHFWSANLRYQIVPSCFKFCKMPCWLLFLGGSSHHCTWLLS